MMGAQSVVQQRLDYSGTSKLDTVGPCRSVHNGEVVLYIESAPSIVTDFPVVVCHVFESLALLECREVLNNCKMDRNSMVFKKNKYLSTLSCQ